ncbi:MFS transporter [Nocardia sp. NPDC046473]|uniref:MFS transporter n=1 Tax=Nocardia sp. NPDC046473 TaxID=3155733 RepID=UPI0033FE2BAE
MRTVLARPRLRRYLVAQAISILGDSALFVAFAIWAKTLTGSSSAVSLIFLVLLLPLTLAPLAGYLVDQVRGKRLLITVNIATGLLVLLLLLVHDRGQLWLLYAVAFCYGCSSAITGSARSTLIRHLTADRDELISVNGALQVIRKNMELFGPLAGAGLFAWLGGPAVAILDSATFFLAAAIQATIAIDEPIPERANNRWGTALAAGFLHIKETVELRQILLGAAAGLFVIGCVNTLIFAALDAIGRPPSFAGVLEAIMAAGAIGSSLIAPMALRNWGTQRVVFGGLVLLAAGMVLLAVPLLGVVVLAMALVGASVPPVIVSLTTAAQTKTPVDKLGRVVSVVQLATSAPQVLAAAVAAALIAVLPYRAISAIAAVLIAVCALWLVTRRQAASEQAAISAGHSDEDSS